MQGASAAGDMAHHAPSPSIAAVIVAAGKGVRAGQEVPKQFALWRGMPVIRHSALAFASAGVSPIIVAIPDGAEAIAKDALSGIEGIVLLTGGATRQQSVRIALDALEADSPEIVMIHDAARPDLPSAIIGRLADALTLHEGAIPVLPIVDSLSLDQGGIMAGTANREELRRVQTPQAFRYRAILAAHHDWAGSADAGDDAQVLRAAGGTVAHVPGDEALKKLTFAEDFAMKAPLYRTGLGYDVHRLADGEELWLGGIRIDYPRGLSGHSDADVALHALVDALLGATAQGDIGQHFPPSDPQWKGANSAQFVEHAAKLTKQAGYAIANVDLTIICEAPKIGPYRDAMRARIAELLSLDVGQVSVKATTTERLGFAGRGEGIAVQAIATVYQQG